MPTPLPVQYYSLLAEQKQKRLKMAQTTLKSKVLEHQGLKMRFQYFLHGQKPQSGYRLVFGFHGGGGCPFQVNEQQWNNHKHLYDQLLPPGTIWFVPRSPEQASDMWWKPYIPEFLQKTIQLFSTMDMIDTNRVFITGYSAGGDGIYHVAGMIADLLAGAAMMAGHPNKADCYNLRNIAFSVQVGATDTAYDRANWGKVYINKIKELKNEYGGFRQYSQVQNTGHWMLKKEGNMFGRFFSEVRDPYPEFVLFRQHPRTFKRTFYYLRLEEKHSGVICVRRRGNGFEIQAEQAIPIKLMVNSAMVDFNSPISILFNGQRTIVTPKASHQIVVQSVSQFLDPAYIFQDQILCIPGTTLPKRIMRPFELQQSPSSINKLTQMERDIREDKKLHVSFNTERNDIVGDVMAVRKVHQGEVVGGEKKMGRDNGEGQLNPFYQVGRNHNQLGHNHIQGGRNQTNHQQPYNYNDNPNQNFIRYPSQRRNRSVVDRLEDTCQRCCEIY